MKYKPYPKYKSSGVEWLGEIPEGWSVGPLFTELKEHCIKNAGNIETNVLSLSYGSIITRDVTDNFGLIPESFETYQIVESDDIILRLTDLQNDQRSLRTGRSTQRGIITSAYVKLRTESCSKFYHALLHAYDIEKIFYGFGGGVRQSMKYSDLRRVPILRPPLSTQQSIAAFLDSETAKIDGLVKDYEELIVLLHEKRQALISHAVTRGLSELVKPTDPDFAQYSTPVTFKPSGVEWLGDIPEGWSVRKMKYLCQITTGGKDTVDANPDGEYPFFVRSQTIERINSYSYDGEAILTAGDGVGVGKVFHHYQGKFDFHQRVYMMHKFVNIDSKFFFYYLRELFSKVALVGGAKSTVDSLRRPVFTEFFFTIPKVDEQQFIVTFLDRETSKIDSLIKETEEAIGLLKEHRSALITSAVTGKINVEGI